MASIHTNAGAIAALQTLRTIGSGMERVQAQVSSGLRVQTASDNAAYWSISTTMRSDNLSISTVADALALGAAKTDVAYSGMDAVSALLSEFKARLVAAKEPGVDRSKIQKELNELSQQMTSIATSASFNGVNWLSTDLADNLVDVSTFKTGIVGSFARSASGTVSLQSLDLDLARISLLNTGGGGALQKDIRSLGTIGGFRPTNFTTHSHEGHQDHAFTGPATFSGTDSITFDLTIDASTHSAGVTVSVTIDKALIDAALGTSDGIIGTAMQMRTVLEKAFVDGGIPATAFSARGSSLTSNRFEIGSLETSGHNGSSIAIAVTSTSFPAGFALGLESNVHNIDHDNMYPSWSFGFDGPFTVHNQSEFSFDVSLGGGVSSTVTVDRSIVDTALGTTDGIVASASALAAILTLAAQGQGMVAIATGNIIELTADQTLYPDAGNKAPTLTINNVRDNIGWIVDFDLTEVDITDPLDRLDHYLAGVEEMLGKTISAAATLGSLQSRIDMQSSFARNLMDTIDRGIGRLVDADMNDASTRLKALQTQQHLANQALQIANTNSDSILQLLR
ncbi:flagellin [Pararhizobium polonicum]|uniref:Flagellin n=1 Tax=Pararhizobium polonicum TaxID=1612624 RepID=A0A1C7NVF4_9HYPH|nr:flagellin [Pararhizobium polonicum]OBZ92980.1 flagellin [Pararhizobium polonicum]